MNILQLMQWTRASRTPLAFTPEVLVIAGWTGRNPAAVEHHIRELEALGVARPVSIPVYYRVAAANLTTAVSLQVAGTGSTGEVECVLLSTSQGLMIGVGSDHTDRELERHSVTLSKQACGKPLGREVWPFAEVAEHWDALELRSIATIAGKRVLYQCGNVAALRPPVELAATYAGRDELPVGTVMFCGTLAGLAPIEFAEHFEMELRDPVLGRTLKHQYDIVPLPVAG